MWEDLTFSLQQESVNKLISLGAERRKEGDYHPDPLSPLLLLVQATPCLTSCLVLEVDH